MIKKVNKVITITGTIMVGDKVMGSGRTYNLEGVRFPERVPVFKYGEQDEIKDAVGFARVNNDGIPVRR